MNIIMLFRKIITTWKYNLFVLSEIIGNYLLHTSQYTEGKKAIDLIKVLPYFPIALRQK